MSNKSKTERMTDSPLVIKSINFESGRALNAETCMTIADTNQALESEDVLSFVSVDSMMNCLKADTKIIKW